MKARSSTRRVRVAWPLHERHGQYAECLATPVHGTRLVRYSDGLVGVLEAHEWEAA